MRNAVAVLAVLSGMAFGQVSSSDVSIKTIDHEGITYQVGAKNVSAVILERDGTFAMQMFDGAPLRADVKYPLQWQTSDGVKIAAVLFQDGSVVGKAVDRDGVDYVQKVVAFRRGRIQEWKKWNALVHANQNHHDALRAYLDAAHSLGDLSKKTGDSDSETGRLEVRHHIQSLADRIEKLPEEQAYSQLVDEVTTWTLRAQRVHLPVEAQQ